MNLALPHRTGNRQRGAAAVELAVLLPIVIILLTGATFFARCFWHYTVAQKAAQDAARYLSSISVTEMRSRPLAIAAATVAEEIARVELSDLNPGRIEPDVVIECGRNPCRGVGSAALPQSVRVSVYVDMFDTIFGTWNTGDYGLRLSIDIEVPYVGR